MLASARLAHVADPCAIWYQFNLYTPLVRRGRQVDADARAGSRSRVNQKASAVTRHQAANDGESEPPSFIEWPARKERLEDARKIAGLDSSPVVCHLQNGVTAGPGMQ